MLGNITVIDHIEKARKVVVEVVLVVGGGGSQMYCYSACDYTAVLCVPNSAA